MDDTDTLKDELIKKIEEYLNGTISETEVSKWASSKIANYSIRDDDVAFGLMDLMGLDDVEKFRTAKEDLIRRKEDLMGK